MQSTSYNTEDFTQVAQPSTSNKNDYSKSPQPVGLNASYYGTAPPAYTEGVAPEAEGERGLGSTLVGGIGGAYVGHQMGGGMATAGGAVVGALGANAVSHGLEYYQQQQQQQQYQQQQYQPQYQQVPYPPQGYQQPMPGMTTTTTTTTTNGQGLGRLGGLGGGLAAGLGGGLGRLGHRGRVLNHMERRSELLGRR